MQLTAEGSGEQIGLDEGSRGSAQQIMHSASSSNLTDTAVNGVGDPLTPETSSPCEETSVSEALESILEKASKAEDPKSPEPMKEIEEFSRSCLALERDEKMMDSLPNRRQEAVALPDTIPTQNENGSLETAQVVVSPHKSTQSHFKGKENVGHDTETASNACIGEAEGSSPSSSRTPEVGSSENAAMADEEDRNSRTNSKNDNGTEMKGGSDSESDVEFLDEIPKQIQNQVELPVSDVPDRLLTADDLRARFAAYVASRGVARTDSQQKVTELLSRFLRQESQLSPLGVRKLLSGGDFQTPVTVSLPPSQTVKFLVEHPGEKSLRSLIVDTFGTGIPESSAERRNRQEFRLHHPAPHFSRTLYDLGMQLAQEKTYSDIVGMKNLPSEMPQKPETVHRVIGQIKPHLQVLRRDLAHLKLTTKKCTLCGFQTENRLVLERHLQFPHEDYGKWHCGYCSFYSSTREDASDHYRSVHGCVALFEPPPPKAPCPFCEEEFQFKGLLQNHLRQCRKVFRQTMLFRPGEQDQLVVSRWLWEKPLNVPASGISTGVSVRSGPVPPVTGIKLVNLPNFGLGRSVLSAPGQLRRVANILPKQPATTRFPSYTPNRSILSGSQLSTDRPESVALLQGNVRILQAPNPPRQEVRITKFSCEICDVQVEGKDNYLKHFQGFHGKLHNKSMSDMGDGAPLACSRCRDRFWTYEGLERHLVMAHNLVTSDLLVKAQQKRDSGRCKLCAKQYAFNLLQHLVVDHRQKLCSAEILYSCDVCTYSCKSYTELESHLATQHGSGGRKRPMGPLPKPPLAKQPRLPSTLSAPPPKKPAKLRYTCTPCSLKFAQYGEVIAHWQDRHLKKLRISLCRVDKCEKCIGSLGDELKVQWDPPDAIASVSSTSSEIICLD